MFFGVAGGMAVAATPATRNALNDRVLCCLVAGGRRLQEILEKGFIKKIRVCLNENFSF